MSDKGLKIAVFIDFDNIEIGVKTTLASVFDVGAVLEALKERGEVVSKVAYGDWTRAGDYSRSLTQHAVKMVQRNLTPGGDKNGADINLALDALEMVFTHEHIDTFVIVGGDSDFITLVEKLKQYDKKVFVVGGRAFTSIILQRNCYEFIAYENLMTGQSRRRGGRGRSVAQAPIGQVLPLVKRALKVLSDREVSPQLGLLKTTLLQLDSTFSERTYGAGSFRDFAERLESAGLVILKQSGRNVQVELKDGGGPTGAVEVEQGSDVPAVPAETPSPKAVVDPERLSEGVEEIRRLFSASTTAPRWPMYVRQMRQFLRSVDQSFDERRYGTDSLLELMRACQRDGLFRLERDRRGILRIYPPVVSGPSDATPESKAPEPTSRETAVDDPTAAAMPVSAGPEPAEVESAEPEAADEVAATAAKPKPTRRRKTAAASGVKKTAAASGVKKTTAASGVRKTTRPRAVKKKAPARPRARKRAVPSD